VKCRLMSYFDVGIGEEVPHVDRFAQRLFK